MEYFKFLKILEESKINETTMQQGVENLKSDKSQYGQMAWEGLQSIYDALKSLATQNPQKLMGIIQKIKSELQQTNPDIAKNLSSRSNNFISKSKQIASQNPQDQSN